jgi:hypothetical protein
MAKASFWGREHDDAINNARTGSLTNPNKEWSWLNTRHGGDWNRFMRGEVYPKIAKELFDTTNPTPAQVTTAEQFYTNINRSPLTTQLLRSFQDNDGKTLPRYEALGDALQEKFRNPQFVLNMEAALRADQSRTLDDRIRQIADNPERYPNGVREIENWNGSAGGLTAIVDRLNPRTQRDATVGAANRGRRVVVEASEAPAVSPRPTPRNNDQAAASVNASPSGQGTRPAAAPTRSPTVAELRQSAVALFTSDEARAGFVKSVPEDMVNGIQETIKTNPAVQDHLARSLASRGELFDAVIEGSAPLNATQKLEITTLMMPVLFAKGVEGKPGSEGVLRAELRDGLRGMDIDPNKADSFANYILGSPKAQENLAKLATESPDVLKMLTGKGGQLSDTAKKLARGEIVKLMDNPQLLEDDKHIADLRSKAGVGQMLAGISDWMKNTLGIDLMKIFDEFMDGAGSLFNGLFSHLGGFFGNLGDGNVIRQAAGPEGFKGMMERVSASSQYAADRAGVSARIRGYEGLDVTGDRKVSDGIDRYASGKREGQEIMYVTQNGQRIEVVPAVGNDGKRAFDANKKPLWAEAVNGEVKQGGKTFSETASNYYNARNDDRFEIVDAQGNKTKAYASDVNRSLVSGQVVITDVDLKTGKTTGGHTTITNGVVSIFGADGKEIKGEELKTRAAQLGVKAPGMDVAMAAPAG